MNRVAKKREEPFDFPSGESIAFGAGTSRYGGFLIAIYILKKVHCGHMRKSIISQMRRKRLILSQ